MEDKKVQITINLSKEHADILRVVVACGIVRSEDEAIGEALNLFKGLISKYIQLLDCKCVDNCAKFMEEE